MTSNTERFFQVGAAFFASALAKLGTDSLRSSEIAAKSFGLPASSRETLAYMPVWGIRDLGFGVAILSLLAANWTGVITGGAKPAALVTGVGACVGLGDSLLVRAAGGKGAGAHAVGASGMLIMAVGLVSQSRPACYPIHLLTFLPSIIVGEQ